MFPLLSSNNKTQAQPQSQPQRQAAAEENAGRVDEQPPAPLRREGSKRTKEIPESTIKLTTIRDLRKRITVKEHQGIFINLVFRSTSWF